MDKPEWRRLKVTLTSRTRPAFILGRNLPGSGGVEGAMVSVTESKESIVEHTDAHTHTQTHTFFRCAD